MKDINPSFSQGPLDSNPRELVTVGSLLFFQACDSLHGCELWKSDGTATGTLLVKDILPGAASSSPSELVNVDGTLFFTADDGTNGRELWRSEGTALGTHLVKDINPTGSSSPESLTIANETLFFSAFDGTQRELWKSDGIPAGTMLFEDVNLGPPSSFPEELTVAGPRLFFQAEEASTRQELWAVNIATDVAVTKTDGQATAVPGQPIAYTIVVTNKGPIAVVGATFTDALPAAITGARWTCVAAGAAACTPSGVGSINDTVDLALGSSLTYTLAGMISPAGTGFGVLFNTAAIALAGVFDHVPANNSATDIDTLTPQADLSVTKTDGQATAAPGQGLVYTIVAANAGPSDAMGATIQDTLPASLQGASWTCVGAGGGTCSASGVGDINDSVNLPAGSSVTYTLSGTVSNAPSRLENTVTLAAPSGVADPILDNNSATDEDLLLCFGETVIVPDGRLTEGVIGAGQTRWFAASLRERNSYSVEFKNATGSGPVLGTLTLFSGEDGCSGTSTLPVRDTTTMDPAGNQGAARVSFTAAGPGHFYRVRLVNGSPSALSGTVSWSDTTMYSPTWSTNAAFDSFYSFQNTTGAAVSGTLTLLDTAGMEVANVDLSIPAGRTASTNTKALGVTRNRTGTARFTHDGPPGAVLIEAAIANFTLSPAYVQGVKFQAVREAR